MDNFFSGCYEYYMLKLLIMSAWLIKTQTVYNILFLVYSLLKEPQ